jgi:predicted transcriptional regulator
VEGEQADEPLIGALLRQDVPICRPDELVQAVRERLAGKDLCLVLNEAGMLQGRLAGREFEAAGADSRAEDVMYPGPSTFRPNVPVAEMREYMNKRNMKRAPVTDPGGRYMGMIYREDLPDA